MINPIFNEHQDQERRRQLAAFLHAKRQSIDLRAKRIGTYTRRENRVGRHFTQEEVAEALSISRQWYAALEMGSSVRPSTALIDRIASLFDLSEHERTMLFRLGIREFATALTSSHALFEGPSPTTPFASAVSSPTEIDAAAGTLARMREQYHTKGMTSGASARPRILDSWERCRTVGIDPHVAAVEVHRDLADLRTMNERLLCAARPAIAQLAGDLADSGYAIVLTDAQGYVLDFSGDAQGRRHCSRAQFEPGANMSETVAGTNAIGTAIIDRRPLQMIAGEHFCDAFVSFTCTAAPIYTSTRELAGVLDISGPFKLARPHLMGVVMQAALEIEEQLALL